VNKQEAKCTFIKNICSLLSKKFYHFYQKISPSKQTGQIAQVFASGAGGMGFKSDQISYERCQRLATVAILIV